VNNVYIFSLGIDKFHLELDVNLFISSSTDVSTWKFEVVNGVNKYNFSLVRIRDNTI
jgi:hypothetical protein